MIITGPSRRQRIRHATIVAIDVLAGIFLLVCILLGARV